MPITVLVRPERVVAGESFHVIVMAVGDLLPGEEFVSNVGDQHHLHAMSRTGVSHLDYTAPTERGDYEVRIFRCEDEKTRYDELHDRKGNLIGSATFAVVDPDITTADEKEEAMNRERWNY